MWGKVDRLECRCRWMENPKTLLSRENGVRWDVDEMGECWKVGRVGEAAGICNWRGGFCDGLLI